MSATLDPRLEFPKVEKMLYSLAWKFSKSYGMPFEQARSEAYAGFMKACNNYKPKKGMKFSSWCYLVTWGYLKSDIMSRAKDPLVFVEIEENLFGSAAEPVPVKILELMDQIPHRSLQQTFETLLSECPAELWEATEGLSSEAEHLLQLFWECPREIINASHKNGQIRQALAHLEQKYGSERAEAAYQELRSHLREAFV